jgi:hypothetical protein
MAHEYTQEFNNSYSYWKDDISVKVAAYMYIGGLKNGSVRAELMTNWQNSKYTTLMDLQKYYENSDYENDSIEHHLNDIFVIRREIAKISPAGSAIVCTLKTRIDTTLSPCLEAVGKEVSHSQKNVESRVKLNIKRKFLSCSKKLMGGDLVIRNSMDSIEFTNSLWKDVVTLWA